MKNIKEIVLIEPRAPGQHFFKFAKLPRLGLPLLGAILKKLGYQVKIFCEELAPIEWNEVLNADLVGISTITSTATRAYRLLKKIKEAGKNIPIVMGGPHVTFLPEEALSQGADYVVRKEGEETLVELLNHLQDGDLEPEEVAGLSFRRGKNFVHTPDRRLLKDLDDLPFPDFTLVEGVENMGLIPIQTSRGCPHNCKFCSVWKMFGRSYRTRSAENVTEELELLSDHLPKSHIFFYDDNFSAHPERTKKILDNMIRSNGITHSWSAQESVKVTNDKELLELMERSGGSHLCLGLESIDPDVLKDYGKRQSVEEIENSIKALHDHNLAVHGMFIFGGDSDKPSTVKKTLDFSLKNRIDTAQYSILTPLPGTITYNELNEQGRIFSQGVNQWQNYDAHHVVYQPKLMTPLKLQISVLDAMTRFYSYWHGVKCAAKGRFKNSFFAFYGHHIIKKWKKQNIEFLNSLKKRGIKSLSGV